MKALKDEDNFDIPMTSLIDIVFLLLIFFLVATNFSRLESIHSFRLPKSQAGEKEEKAIPQRLNITVNKYGICVVNGSTVEEAELVVRIRQFLEEAPDRPIAIYGETGASYDSIQRVIGLARKNGAMNLQLPFEPALWEAANP